MAELSQAWDRLTLEQQCGIALSIGDCDLRTLLVGWDQGWPARDLADSMRRLGRAVLQLVDEGLIEVLPPNSGSECEPLSRAEVAEVVADPKAWWDGGEGVAVMVWLVLTDPGLDLVRCQPHEKLYAFMTRQE
jgi:hypothetical protein